MLELQEIVSARWTKQRILDVYGLDFTDNNLTQEFKIMLKYGNSSSPLFGNGGRINRFAMESMLKIRNYVPFRVASFRLGMTEEDLLIVLNKLAKRGFIRVTQEFSKSGTPFATQDLIDQIHKYFRIMSNAIFGDHNQFCSTLHSQINKVLGHKVKPVYCVTSKILSEPEKDYAYYIDCVTGDPIGLKYKFWLDFGKPMNLEPDYCSLVTAAINPSLKPYYFSETPEAEFGKGLIEKIKAKAQ